MFCSYNGLCYCARTAENHDEFDSTFGMKMNQKHLQHFQDNQNETNKPKMPTGCVPFGSKLRMPLMFQFSS